MMRWVILAVIVIAISAVAAFVAMSGSSSEMLNEPGFFPGASRPKGPPPKLVLDGALIHEFGLMGQQKKGQHLWEIRNEGPGDLILKGGQPSCSCTVLNLKPGAELTVKPGEAYSLKVEWETRANMGPYEKSASVYSNDATYPELVFHVKGTIRPALVTMPPYGEALDLHNVPNTKPFVATAFVGSPDHPETKITKIVNSQPELLDVTAVPLSKEEAKVLDVKRGYKLNITVKPSEKIGGFSEKIVVKTDHPDGAEAEFTVVGRVVGPISVVPSMVKHNIAGHTGGSTSVKLWVQGQDQTEFTVVKKPDKLKVTIAPDDEKGKPSPTAGTGRAYRLTATVAPGTPACILDEPIVLKTNHPGAGEIEIPVEILVTSED